jgi:hypothetical protein
MPFEIFGEEIFRVKKNFIDETSTGPSLGQSASFDAACVQFGSVVWSVCTSCAIYGLFYRSRFTAQNPLKSNLPVG